MTQDQLTSNFDQVFSPKNTMEPLVNGPGQNDLAMGKHFKNWLHERKKKEEQGIAIEPFFAQFYYWNAHDPYFTDKTVVTNITSRKDGMLMTVDKSIENIFQLLSDAGELDNTIVLGSSDHGENCCGNKVKYRRLTHWNANILHPAVYMYVPRKISEKSAKLYQNLRYNTRQLISTLDLFPTLMQFLDINESKEDDPGKSKHCVTGFNLLKNRIPTHRIAWSIPGVSSPKIQKRGLMAMHYGTSSSLMNRWGYPKHNGMSVIRYHDIIGSLSTKNETKVPLKIDEWRSVMQNMTRTNDKYVLKSDMPLAQDFVKSFAAKNKIAAEQLFSYWRST